MMAGPDPTQDQLPQIVIGVPGRWGDADEFARHLAKRGGGYLVQDGAVVNVATGRPFPVDLAPRDPRLGEQFALAGEGRFGRADLDAVRRHACVAYVRGRGGSTGAAREMMRVATALMNAGGIAVKVESSGVCHSRADWFKLAGDKEPGGLYWAYVATVGRRRGGREEFYSCGMHALGYRDAITGEGESPGESAFLIHNFNGYTYQAGIMVSDGDPLGDENGPLFRVRHEPCSIYPPGMLYHNPYGMWRICRYEAGAEN